MQQEEKQRIRSEARHYLELLLKGAKRQGCYEEVLRFPELFVVFVLSVDVFLKQAVESGVVNLHDLCDWFNELVYGEKGHGTASG